MSVRRFLSRRDRDKSPSQHHNHHHHHQQSHTTPHHISPQHEPRKPDHFDGVFTLQHDSPKKQEKDEEKKIKSILERLRHYGIDNFTESHVEYALHAQSSQGDPEAAFRLLMTLEDTYEGIVKPYTPDMKLLGAVNRDAVTCYLDALLFAMFAKLDSFEAMLYENFTDAKRKRLAGLLRLWVNMLRTGRLITTDLTEHIQHALADCGWNDAVDLMQQDPSEAFTFITGQLELPMLTLKMDMYHTGKEDPQDDHKFVNERLLEVAIVDAPREGQDVITLEDCLEHYFNNRIEVKRHLENQRRNTLKSANDAATRVEKESSSHVEVLEVAPETPAPTQSPAVLTPPAPESPTSQSIAAKVRPTSGRKRADSIFSQRKVELVGIDPESLPNTDDAQIRKTSTRTEVLMPAWQFFKLLPWYTANMPTSDAQVAAHFSTKRPVLGICLKRYSYTNTGQARRRDTFVDIPLEIAVPNFVGDDCLREDLEGPVGGNFRLVLQSVVCHRGISVHSGHYVCLSRGTASSEEAEDPWMLFDDLASPRVSQVSIHDALKRETPYLLFYQVLPIGDPLDDDLPSYTEATSRSQSEALTSLDSKPHPSSEDTDLDKVASEPTTIDTPRTSTSAPSTPIEEKPNSFLAVANKFGGSRRSSRQQKTSSRRAASAAGGSGIGGINMSRLSLNRGGNGNGGGGEEQQASEEAEEEGISTAKSAAHVGSNNNNNAKARFVKREKVVKRKGVKQSEGEGGVEGEERDCVVM